MDISIIGRRLREARKAKKFSQQRLADEAFVNVKYLSNIENGRDKCSITVLLNLANALGVSIDYLLGDNLSYNRRTDLPQSDEVYDFIVSKLNAMDTKGRERVLQFINMLEN